MNTTVQRQIVLDTETTGLSAEQGDRIVELGCVELVQRRLTGNNLHLYFNPDRDSEEGALRVHGLTRAFLSDKPRFAERSEEIVRYLEGAEIIIHNAAFDMGFLEMEFARLKLPRLTDRVANVLDTLSLARDLYPGKRNTLDALCDRRGGPVQPHFARRVAGCATPGGCLHSDDEGQESLLSTEGDATVSRTISIQACDLSAFTLPVLRAGRPVRGTRSCAGRDGQGEWRKNHLAGFFRCHVNLCHNSRFRKMRETGD